jgi:hypothetical protein
LRSNEEYEEIIKTIVSENIVNGIQFVWNEMKLKFNLFIFILIGIKGETLLSQHLNIFKDVAYDFMHLCCEGYVKRFLHCLLDSKNNKEQYYIAGNFHQFFTLIKK